MSDTWTPAPKDHKPERLGPLPTTIYQVPKVCACGTEWMGNSFAPAPADGSAVPHLCRFCIAKAERHLAQLDAASGPPAVERIELERPRRADIDD